MTERCGLEIERTFLLRTLPSLPKLPSDPERLEIEQGYFPSGGQLEGRVRRIRHADGRVEYFHTVKSGLGLVRQETERALDAAEFAQHWPLTEGRRLRKTRHRVQVGELTWEIDQFHDLPAVEGRPLMMAEVEIPEGVDPQGVPIPEWISTAVVREVTEEPRFRNYALATSSATI